MFFQVAAIFTSVATVPIFSLFLMGGISRHANWKVRFTFITKLQLGLCTPGGPKKEATDFFLVFRQSYRLFLKILSVAHLAVNLHQVMIKDTSRPQTLSQILSTMDCWQPTSSLHLDVFLILAVILF